MANRLDISALQTVKTLVALARIRFLGARIPLFFEWNLTFRCNLRCKYCGACDAPSDELNTESVKAGLDGLTTLGTRWVTFGGGEPLLRKDLGEIVQHAKEKGFQVYLSTNGSLLSKNRGILEYVDHVNLSLDGPASVHDAVRGKDAFKRTLEGIAVVRESNASASLQCTLSSLNLEHIEETVAIAIEQGLPVMFQPATQWLDSSRKPNPIAPEVDAYRETVARLIELKRAGAPIRNSIPGLRHLARWPDATPIWCSAGLLTCSIEPDGTMLACHQLEVGRFLKGKAGSGPLPEQFKMLPLPGGCGQCWCAPIVELALLLSFKPGAVLNALRMFL